MMQLAVWILICLGIIAIAAVIQRISKRKLIRWVIKIAAVVTACIIILMLADDLSYIIKYISMQYGIWLASCLTVTIIIALVHLNNKSSVKRNRFSGLATDEEYRELAYELHHLNLDCYEYEKIYEGFYGKTVFEFTDISNISDRVLERTLEQRDYIMIKTAVEEYIQENISFQGKK